MLLTACQPTPEVPPVVNKVEAERVQQQRIEATQPPTQKPAYTAPDEWREALLTEQDGKFSIVMDADIVYPTGQDIAVYSATPLTNISQQRFDQLLDGFFGDTPLLRTEEYSLETLNEWLLEGKKSLAEMENGSFDFTMYDNYDGSEEINADRLAHGKKPLKNKDDDDTPDSGGNGKTIAVSTTDPQSGLFHKGEHKVEFAYTAQFHIRL